MSIYEIIQKKKRGGELSTAEIEYAVNGYVKGDIPDYQMSALLMAICFTSLSDRETLDLTMTMARSGDTIDLSPLGFCVDKHSTGGVGDKVTLIAAPIAAACGAKVAKMSGRGLGHTGGTIDKFEAIPNFNTSLNFDEFIRSVKEIGFAITGQTGNLVPADKKLYALRDCTATIDSIPLICSSIMSKKLASGADGIVLDVKYGSGAFMKTAEDGQKLAQAMVKVGELAGRKMSAVLSDMNKPLGKNIGNSLEVIEAIEVLKGRGDKTLRDVSIDIAAEMLFLADIENTKGKCLLRAKEAIKSGKALDVLKAVIENQGGNPDVADDVSLLPQATFKMEVYAKCDGIITSIDCEKIGLTALKLGAGRATKESVIDYSAGIVMEKTLGDKVAKGDVLGVLHTSRTDIAIGEISEYYYNAYNYTACEAACNPES